LPLKKNIKVIYSKLPDEQNLWRFWDYGTQEANLFDEWYCSVSPFARDLIDGILKNCLKVADHQQWLAFKRFLTGKYKSEKIWELRFKADRREYRILGIFGPQRKEAILLMGCYHKDGNYTPPSALDVAHDRAKAVKLGRWKPYARKIRADL
jgi:hypothetical protein